MPISYALGFSISDEMNSIFSERTLHVYENKNDVL